MRKTLYLLIAFCCISVFCFSVIAQDSVGLNQGDWVEYEVTYTGSPPESHPVKLRIEVNSIVGTNVTVVIHRDLINGTQDSRTTTFDLGHGAPDFIIIWPNLAAGDEVFHKSVGKFTVDGVADYSFKGVTRERVYANVLDTDFSWDRSTGVVVEAYHRANTFTETLLAVNTNLVSNQTSNMDPMLLYAIVAVVIISIVVLTFIVFKRRKKEP